MNNSKKPETGARLFIGGFSRNTSDLELQEFCSRFGKVKKVDIIPNKQLAFVTFHSKEEATLALFGVQQQAFKGNHLRVDWAKENKKKNENKDKDNAKATDTPKKDEVTKDNPKQDSFKKDRYIPGDMKEVTSVLNKEAVVMEDIALNSENLESEVSAIKAAPEPVPLTPIPNLNLKNHYPESEPPLEISIRDTQTNDIKYTFRVKSLSHLKNFLLAEANGDVSAADLFHSRIQKTTDHIVYSYGSVPVVHTYEGLFGKEVIEPRENKEQRESFLKKRQNNNRGTNEIPEAKVPLSTKKIPVEEIYHLLVSKGYDYVLLNTSKNGPSAPLHPEWKPLANTYGFKKASLLVMFNGKTYVESFQFLNPSTTQSYKDFLPILLKYDVCIFNSNKGAFITPEQLQ